MAKKRYGKSLLGTDKKYDLHIRIGVAEYTKLKEIVAFTGKSKSDIMRAALRLYGEMYRTTT